MASFNREIPEERNDTMKKTGTALTVASVAAAITLIGFAAASCDEKKDVSQKSSEASIVTNDNGSVARTYVEATVTTNGNMVTERRRETRTTLDADGNMLESSTSEYAQSYPVGEEGMASFATPVATDAEGKCGAAKVEEGFLGLKFGEEFKGTNFVADADEPTLLRAAFEPAKKLAGFDDYYAFVTPKSHKLVKVCACAKNEVESNVFGRRHYLVEALEKRYGVPARLASWIRPLYVLDIAPRRGVSICLSDAASDYETVITAWDDDAARTAASELRELRDESYRKAIEERNSSVDSAAEAF
jgi:hypothetical protein